MSIINLIATVVFFGLWAGVWFVGSRFFRGKGVWRVPSHLLAGILGFLAGVIGIVLIVSLVGALETPSSAPRVENETPEVRTYGSSLSLSVVKESLWSWDPIDVRLAGKALVIITQEDRVTDQVYRAIVMSGVCPMFWQNPDASLRVSEVRVLNKFGRQGYVFEGEADLCHWLGKQEGGDRYIPGITRLHTNN